jgi:hypothetical protein
VQGAIDGRLWQSREDLAEVYLNWGGYAYGGADEGTAAREQFAQRLSQVQAVLQNQDNREHDLLDSNDYYQFQGGMLAAGNPERRQGRQLPRRPQPAGPAEDPHLEGRAEPGDPLPRRQPQVDRRGQAPRL